MLQLTFMQEEIEELDYQRYHHPHPRVQRKMEALLLSSKHGGFGGAPARTRPYGPTCRRQEDLQQFLA